MRQRRQGCCPQLLTFAAARHASSPCASAALPCNVVCLRAGYVFGKGIYFSCEPHVAFAFALPTQGWRASALGARLRCLLCCSIERDAALGSHNDDLVRLYVCLILSPFHVRRRWGPCIAGIGRGLMAYLPCPPPPPGPGQVHPGGAHGRRGGTFCAALRG